ncbi:MAG: hypothetical protein RMM31_11640 [Anaerolineae bacterium]|nr:hypothetical protein [Anaerolineae bacterium]
MSYEIVVASRHDPEVYKEAHELLRPYLNRAKCALVMLDYDGCGASVSCAQVEQDIETNLQRNGWSADCCAAVAIEPELEAWVWRDSVHIRRALGYGLEHSEKLTAILHRHGLQTNGKVSRPKEALIEALKESPSKKPKSSNLFAAIAQKVSLQGCQDRAFNKLCQVLQRFQQQCCR